MNIITRRRNCSDNVSDHSDGNVQIARYYSIRALMTRYKNPVPKLIMERFDKKQYRSSWKVNEDTIAEAYIQNIFNISPTVYCGETNRPETGFSVIIKQSPKI